MPPTTVMLSQGIDVPLLGNDGHPFQSLDEAALHALGHTNLRNRTHTPIFIRTTAPMGWYFLVVEANTAGASMASKLRAKIGDGNVAEVIEDFPKIGKPEDSSISDAWLKVRAEWNINALLVNERTLQGDFSTKENARVALSSAEGHSKLKLLLSAPGATGWIGVVATNRKQFELILDLNHNGWVAEPWSP